MITTAVFKDLNSTFINWDEIQIEAVKRFLIYISTYIYLLPGGFYVHRSILERSLTDNIAEAQAKLGYSKNTMQFYYPLRTLNHFFNSEWEADEMNKALQGFIDFVAPRFGETRIEYKEHRFCFYLSEAAPTYVHEHKEKNEFIFELIQLLLKPDTSLETVTSFFKEWDKNCVIKEVNNDEFDILITFTDRDDPYYYCFKDEELQIVYHRFLPEDYEDFGF